MKQLLFHIYEKCVMDVIIRAEALVDEAFPLHLHMEERQVDTDLNSMFSWP